MPKAAQPPALDYSRESLLARTLRQIAENASREAPPGKAFRTPRPPTLTESTRDVIVGNPQSGETAIGRALGYRYEKAGEQTPSTELPLLQFESITPEPGVRSGIAKTATAMTTAPSLLLLGAGGAAGPAFFQSMVGRLVSAGFGAELVHRAYQRVPEFRAAVDAGDEGKAKEVLTLGALEILGGAAGVKTAATGRLPIPGLTRRKSEIGARLTAAEERAATATSPVGRRAAGIQMEQLAEQARALEAPRTPPPPGPATRAGERTLRPLTSESGVLQLPDAKSWWQRNEARWVDEFAPIRDLERLGDVAPSESAYNAARLFAGHFGKIVEKERELRRILRPVAKEKLVPELDRFLELERHQELFGRPDVGPGYRTPGGRSQADIATELQAMRTRLGPDAMDRIDLAARQTRTWSDNILREYHDSGLISDDAYNAILTSNHRYSPLQRMAYLADELDALPVGGRTFNVRGQKIVYPIKGSTQDVLPATEAFLRNAYRMVTLADRNRVNSRLADLSSRPEFTNVIRPIGRSQSVGPTEGRIFTVRNGVKEAYAVPAPVADAVSGMGVRDVDTLSRWISGTNRALVEGSTRFYLPFIAKNIWRDYQTATLRSAELGKGVWFTPIDWMAGLWSAVGRDKYYDAYLRSGASFSGFFERQATVKKSLQRVTESELKRVARRLVPWEMMRILAETSELAPRLGYLRKALKSDIPIEQAGLMTRQATVDFARMGTSMKKLNMWIPFINARLQGTLAVGGALQKHPGRSAVVLTAIMGLPEIGTYIHNVTEHPKVWDDIRQYEKQNNFLFILGDAQNNKGEYTQVVKIPKGDIGRWFGNPLEDSLERYRVSDPKGFGQMALELASDVSPMAFTKDGEFSWEATAASVLPPIVRAGIIEPLANKNLYTGRDIEHAGMREPAPGVAPKERYTPETPAWVVKAAQVLPDFLGISPMQLQNFIVTQFGGVGRLAAGDINPDRGPEILQRTGVSASMRAFGGAMGGGVDEGRFKRGEEVVQEENTDRFKRNRLAEQIYAETMAAPANERLEKLRSRIQSGELDEPTMEKFIDNVLSGAKGLTPYERWLYQKPVAARAKIIVDEINRLPSVDAKVAFFKRLYEAGAVTEGVLDQIAEQYGKQSPAKRQRTGLEEAFGIQ